MDKQERTFWLAAALIFALFAGLLYFPVFSGRIPFPAELVLQFPAWSGATPPTGWSYADIGDLVTFFYPSRVFAAQAVKQGTLPLWNPLSLSGEPFLANAQSSLFYPPNVLYYLLPVAGAWSALLLLRTFLAALFMAVFVRSIGGSKAGSVFSGITFASCGFMTAWQGQPMGDAAMWLPVVCFAIHKLYETRSARLVTVTALAFAMPVLAGHPEMAAHVTLTGIGLALMLSLAPAKPNTWHPDSRFVASFALAGVLSLGIASIQMIPTIEWLQQMGTAFRWVWPPLSPHQIFAWVSRDILRSPNSAGINIPESATYMGMVSILAVPLAVFHRSKFYIAFFAVIAACALAVAYGVEPMHELVSQVPVLWGVKNSRLVFVANFAFAGLGGLGISALDAQISWTGRKRVLAFTLVGTVFALMFALVYRLQKTTAFKVGFLHRPSFSRTLLILGAVFLLWKLLGGLRGRMFQIAVCALAMFDLGTFAFGYTGFAQPSDIYPRSLVFDSLANQDKSQFRIIDLAGPFPLNTHVPYGLPAADGYEVRLTQYQQLFVRGVIADADGISFALDRVLQMQDRRLDMLNVKYLVIMASDASRMSASDRFLPVFNNGAVAIFENKSVLPRAWIVPASGIEVLPGLDSQLNWLTQPAFDPTSEVLLSRTPAVIAAEERGLRTATVDIVKSGINEIALSTQTSHPAMLIVSQTYYPGWKATIDGTETEIMAADMALTGVPIPPGSHLVRLVFQPASFRIGLWLTILSTVVGLVLARPTFRASKPAA